MDMLIQVGLTIFGGVSVAVIVLLINRRVNKADRQKTKAAEETGQMQDFGQRICTLERHSGETYELSKCTLGMCISIGDGMIQNGINGDFKKDFSRKKDEALKIL